MLCQHDIIYNIVRFLNKLATFMFSLVDLFLALIFDLYKYWHVICNLDLFQFMRPVLMSICLQSFRYWSFNTTSSNSQKLIDPFIHIIQGKIWYFIVMKWAAFLLPKKGIDVIYFPIQKNSNIFSRRFLFNLQNKIVFIHKYKWSIL